MSSWYGSKLIINGPVEPIEPFSAWAQDFFEMYAECLKNAYKELDE